MSRLFAAASSQYLYNANALVTDYPFTVAAWVKPTTVDTYFGTVWACMDKDSVSGASQARLGVSNAAKAWMTAGDGTSSTTTTLNSPTLSAGSWQHITGVWASTTSRKVYFSGSNTEGTTSRALTGLDWTGIGACIYNTSTVLQPFDGRIAHLAVWDVALTADEIALLQAGANPMSVQGSNVISYVPLTSNASPEPDSVWV